jgi:dephospho-CoA kinase
MLKIGITGGIGSGKSTVARLFEVLGIPVYYADNAAKRLMNEDPGLKDKILGYFGPEAYRDGSLDRKFIASQVFSNRQKLDYLNSIVHPATIQDGILWMENQQSPYAIREAALIFESGVARDLDAVIGVSAPQPLRIQRAMTRDQVSREEVLGRMSEQLEESLKMRLCNYIIYNDETRSVIQQVVALHQKFLEMAEPSKGIIPSR